MEKKRLLGSSDSDDALSIYPHRFSRKKRKSHVVEFKRLIKVIKDGKVDEIGKLLNKRSLQLSDSDGLTVLHVGAASNNMEVLSVLLEDQRCSALLNSQDKEGFTPLLGAAMVGSYDTLDLLCARGADPCKTILKYGNINVLHLAARRCDSKAARIVLQYNSSSELINALNANGDTPLVETVYVKSKVMRLLIRFGADISVQNPANGRTVLHVLVAYNRLGLLKEILQHPQATDDFAEIKDIKDDTALLIAVKLNNIEMVTILLNRFTNLTGFNDTDQESVFHITVRQDKVDILRVLLNSGCIYCLDYVDKSQRTPLVYAAELDRAKCLSELIENGADYSLRNVKTGETFIHVIAKCFSYSSLPYVMNIADISWFFTQVDKQGNTPYMTAIINGNAKFLREALKIKQVDLCDKNSEGEPPVYYTAKHGHVDTMRILLMSPRYFSCISNMERTEELSDPDEILKLEMTGDLYAIDVYLLLGKFIKHPLNTWFPPGLLCRTRQNRNVFHACSLGGNLEGLTLVHNLFSLFAPEYLHDTFDRMDLMGNTPLLFAAQCGVVSISCVHFFATRGADLASVNNTGLNFFNAVLTYNPEVAESLITSLLDTCVTGKREHYNEDKLNINVNFNMLCPKDELYSQLRVLYMLYEELTKPDCSKAKRKVLQHPVLELFLKNKYRVQRCYLNLRFRVLFIVTIALSIFLPLICIGESPEKKSSLLTPFLQKVMMISFLLLSFVPVIFKIPNVVQRRVWLTDAVSFVPLILMTLLVGFGRTFVLAPELTAILILSCWIYTMVFMTTMYSTFSFQLAVFFHILNGISKHLAVLIISMLAFSLSFYCIYHDYDKFSSVPRSCIYTFIVLFLGYYPDLPLFKKEYFTTTPVTFHFIVECLLIGAFTFIIVLGFINMLIGLSVRSGNVAESDGKVYQNHHQVHLLYMIEYWFNNNLYWWLLKKGIFTNKLTKLRDKQRIKLNVGLYDNAMKEVVTDFSIRQFRSIIFQQSKLKTTRISQGLEGVLCSWINDQTDTPSPQSLILKQAKWEEENSDQSVDIEH